MDTFNITDKRRTKLIKMFEAGYSITAAAIVMECHRDTLSAKLKQAGIVPSELHQARLNQFQKELFRTIETDLDPDDRVKHGMKYLERYQKLEPQIEVTVTVTDDEVAQQILDDLNV